MGGLRRSRLLATTILSAAVAMLPAVAQDVGEDLINPAEEERREGRYATLTYGLGYERDDNIALNRNSVGTTSAFSNNYDLQFGFASRATTLDFAITGEILAEDSPTLGNRFFINDPTASVEYEQRAARSSLALAASVDKEDLDRLQRIGVDTDGDGEDDTVEIVDGSVVGGSVTETVLRARYTFGIDTPIRYAISFSLADREFSSSTNTITGDVTEPGIDTRTYNLFMSARARLSPVTFGTLSFLRSEVNELVNIASEADTQRLTFDLEHNYADIWTFNLGVGLVDIEERNRIQITDEEDGVDLEFRATRELTWGTAFASAEREVRVSGNRTTFLVGADYELRDGSIGATFGTTDSSNGGQAFLASLDYQKQLRTSQFVASLDRSIQATADATQSDQLITSLSLSYLYQINTAQRLFLGMSYTDIDSTLDESETEFQARYSYQLDRDWDLNFGYRRRETFREAATGDIDATSNSFFINISRELSLF